MLSAAEGQSRTSSDGNDARLCGARGATLRAAAAASFIFKVSFTTPVAIRMPWTALPMTSARRYWPWGLWASSHGPFHRFEQLNRIAAGVIDENLLSAISLNDVAAKLPTVGSQLCHGSGKIADFDLYAIPTAR